VEVEEDEEKKEIKKNFHSITSVIYAVVMFYELSVSLTN
jgi:hypothetical protein